MARLIVRSGGGMGAIHVLDRDIVTLGRDDACRVRLTAEGVAENHAQVFREEGAWQITDLMSGTETRVNGIAVSQRLLEDGDEIRVGEVVLVFSEDPDDADLHVARLDDDDLQVVRGFVRARDAVRREVAKVVKGRDALVDLLMAAVLCRGHVHLRGAPGLDVGRLVRTLASILRLEFRRVECTPDLLPADIVGTEVVADPTARGARSFTFLKGPVFTGVFLADGIDRARPKCQAALLATMEELRVVTHGGAYRLDLPFLAVATSNPTPAEGDAPLTEGQRDRFMLGATVDYPERRNELADATAPDGDEVHPKPVMSGDDILILSSLVRRVAVSRRVAGFATDVVRATRPGTEEAPEFVDGELAIGAGPRASRDLILAAKAHAVLDGRGEAKIEDVRAMATPTLRHRLRPVEDGADIDGIVARVVESLA